MAEPHATETPAAEPSATASAPALEAEADDWADDSGVGEEDDISSTTSIGSSVLKYRQENGRTYHAYKVILLVGSELARY
jgi:hypothetical protein